ncbi:MAG: hypothetical protein U9R48_02055 [Chloroflexota bacterium]|nr:hypothetical protein [Chloroflexota bacterium]
MQKLHHTGWEPIGRSMNKTWVIKNFFRRARQEMIQQAKDTEEAG